MSTLVNREIWHASGAMINGIVREQRFNPDACMVQDDFSPYVKQWLPSSDVALTREDALRKCEAMLEYWGRVKLRLQDELEKEEATK